MPDPPKPKPGAKPKGKGLGRKVGPLPLWAWLAIVGGGAAVWYFFLRGGGGGAGPAGGPSIVTGSGATPQDQAQAGAPSSNAAPGSMFDPSVLEQLLQQGPGETKLESDLQAVLEQLQNQPAGGGAAGPDQGTQDLLSGLSDTVNAMVDAFGGIQTSQQREAAQLGRLSKKVSTQQKTINRLRHQVAIARAKPKPKHPPQRTAPKPKAHPKAKPVAKHKPARKPVRRPVVRRQRPPARPGARR